jgi:D-beta-D-heptose 7-phosphate kinase/D-beta-D-heptose 1-phosphate adenosyltransferase
MRYNLNQNDLKSLKILFESVEVLRVSRFDFRRGHLLSSTLVMTVQKIRSLAEIVQIRNQLRRDGKKLVFTNGCFDLLHAGHVRYLNQARALGDVLVVGLNSDRSVREIKGKGRPITPEDERAEVLAALACVDYIFLFDDLTPQSVIDAIVPDVLAKGADWETSEIVGRQTVERAGGTVQRIPLVEGISTSAIIKKVLDRFGSRRAR